MKVFTAAAMAEIKAGTAIVGGAGEVLGQVPIRLWSGYGDLTFAVRTLPPIRNPALAQVFG